MQICFTDKIKREEFDKKWFDEYDTLLAKNNGSGLKLDKQPVVEAVLSPINYLNGKEINLLAYCVMPNHVHLVFTEFENSKGMSKIMHSIKRTSAREINKLLKRDGPVWQSESYDHIMRNEDDLYRIIEYVLYNPVKAGLVERWEDWEFTFVSEEVMGS